jgi:hypothetical protein
VASSYRAPVARWGGAVAGLDGTTIRRAPEATRLGGSCNGSPSLSLLPSGSSNESLSSSLLPRVVAWCSLPRPLSYNEDELDLARTSPEPSGHHRIRRGEDRSDEEVPRYSGADPASGAAAGIGGSADLGSSVTARGWVRWARGFGSLLFHVFSFFCFFIRFTEGNIESSRKKSHLPRSFDRGGRDVHLS